MKKIIILTLLLTFSFIFVGPVQAANIDFPENQYNILDIANVRQMSYGYLFGFVNDRIDIEENEQYTLVMSYNYIENRVTEVMNTTFDYEDYEGDQDPHYETYINDTSNQRIYVEFTPPADFRIVCVPAIVNPENPNYEIIIYKGDYTTFHGFEPYLTTSFERIEYGEIEMNYDTKLTGTEIQSLVKAYNANNVEISYEITEDNYTSSNQGPGSYEMTFLATINNIKKYYVLSILVLDMIPPTITGPDTINTAFSDKISLEEILTQYTISDNVDLMTIDDIVITNDTYSESSTIGTYTIEFKVTDSSGNTSNKTITINVNDEEAPRIDGPESLMIYATDDPLTNTSILEWYFGFDDVTSRPDVTILTDGYQQTTTPGVYEVVLTTSDDAGNTTNLTIYIQVIDNRAPSFEVESPIVEVTTTEMMSTTDIEVYLKNYLTQQNNGITNLNVLYNEYETHEDQEGSYYVYYEYDLDGTTYSSRLLIEVQDTKDIYDYWYYGLTVIPLGIFIYLIVIKKKKLA